MDYKQWNPADYVEGNTFKYYLDNMPITTAPTPKIITLMENPNSPFYLPGPANIQVHDIVHCLLLRGLLAQDEAFVIGFTMGAAEGVCAKDRIMFKNIAGSLYREPYHFSSLDLSIFDVGFDLGATNEIKNIHFLNPTEFLDLTWIEAVSVAGISPIKLVEAMRKELSLVEKGDVSTRIRKTVEIIKLQNSSR